MAVQTMGTMFPKALVTEMFNKVKGHSSIAMLSSQTPIAFTGNQLFTFSMDKEINIVAEGGAKPTGGITLTPVTMMPLKVEYGARVTDEFMNASEEKQLDILTAFTDGYAKKVSKGLDIMVMHGVNPRDSLASAIIGTNSLDTNTDVSEVIYDAAAPEANLEAGIAAIGDYNNTGYALSKVFATALGSLTVNGVKQYPEFALGGNPGNLKGIPCDVNGTVTFSGKGKAYIGDFANAFKWGYAKDVPFEIIPYGDPDQSGEDLKAHNQVYLRCETYLGWGILDGAAFTRIASAT